MSSDKFAKGMQPKLVENRVRSVAEFFLYLSTWLREGKKFVEKPEKAIKFYGNMIILKNGPRQWPELRDETICTPTSAATVIRARMRTHHQEPESKLSLCCFQFSKLRPRSKMKT